MKRKKVRSLLALLSISLMVAASFTGPPTVSAKDGDSNPPPFDFSDQFYRENGFVPENILMRIGTPGVRVTDWIVDNSNTDPTRRNIRDLETTGGWDASGSLIYYSIFGVAMPNIFERDANGNLTERGAQAMEIANHYRAFLFPKSNGGNPILDPAPPNRRQDNVFDTRNGYFSNNPTGIWSLAFVVYTAKAFTKEGKKVLDPIAAVNGRDLDGTPILQSASLIDDLAQKGLVEIRFRAQDGSQGFPWVF
jgi:hypothetical protein